MSYFDAIFAFLFIPILIVIYNIVPKKFRPYFLLAVSFGFFCVISKFLIAFLLLSILSIYLITNKFTKIDKERDEVLEKTDKDNRKEVKTLFSKKKKRWLVLGILFNVAMLFGFKYVNFFGSNLNYIFDLFKLDVHYSIIKYAAPIGISYYTLQAIAYLVDVYNGKFEADKNICKVALFLSFFPQIMEGPIVRYNDTADQLFEGKSVSYNSFCFGYQRVLYGFFKKFVIADRLNIAVSMIFDSYTTFSGGILFLGAIFYTILLYMEFSGTMDVVIGIGEMFGVKIPENFKQPFFAKNISEFWTRWHISLGLWFKDMIFYPVSLSKPVKHLTLHARKIFGNKYGPILCGGIALFCVWFLNGLWHGAGWPFLFYGMYHFVMILSGNLLEPLIQWLCTKLHINRQNIVYRVLQSVKMALFVFIGEMFFRAPTVRQGFVMLKRIITNFSFSSFKDGGLAILGIDVYDLAVIIIGVLVIFVIGLLKECNINVREEISKKNIVFRWFIYYLLIFSIIMLGAYGPGYIPVDPIYADF